MRDDSASREILQVRIHSRMHSHSFSLVQLQGRLASNATYMLLNRRQSATGTMGAMHGLLVAC
jgi:hypothetical protein